MKTIPGTYKIFHRKHLRMSAHLKCELLVLICKIFMTPYVDKSSHLHTMTNIHAIIEHVGATSLAAPAKLPQQNRPSKAAPAILFHI